MSERGRFITLEGIEGAGKTTVARALVAMLSERGIPVELTREPGGTPLAEKLRDILLHKGEEPMSSSVETLLMFAARGLHLSNRIRPALDRGVWVICDRFTDATRAYQGAGRGVDQHWIESLAAVIHDGLHPDLTLLLDLPVTDGLARARGRRQAAGLIEDDRFESETVEFFERVRRQYLALAGQPDSRILRLDASRSAEEVAAAACATIEQRFATELAAT